MATCKDCLHYDVCKSYGVIMHNSLKLKMTEEVESKCPYKLFKSRTIKTNADRIRAMSDDALCERLYHIWRSEADRGNDIAMNWCHPECCKSEECDPEKHKACILQWLQQPVEASVK